MSSPVPLYIPGWKPHPGSHMEADVGLITRRFITSSSLQDLILNQEPVSRSIIWNVVWLTVYAEVHKFILVPNQ